MKLPVGFCVLLFAPALVVSQSFTARTWEQSAALAKQLVANLTIQEKVGLVSGIGSSRCIGNTVGVNRSLPNAPKGVPSLCLNDGPAGVRTIDLVTGFPGSINAASTFSRRLMRARGQAMGEEFRGKGINVMLGPAMDLMRNPKAGRAWEGFGPDPVLGGEAAFETVQGVQSAGVQACAKHFMTYVQEHFRTLYSAEVDDRTVHELYFWPFMRAIEANVSSIMCSYNRINQTYACGNSATLGPDGILGKAGFQGYVVSDWGATHSPTAQYANSGLDVEYQNAGWVACRPNAERFLATHIQNDGIIDSSIFGNNLAAAVANGTVPQARVDDMVSRTISAWFHLGQDVGYPPPNYDTRHPDGDSLLNLNVSVRSDEHTSIAREVAGASTVLLKNSGALPLTGTERTMAAIGIDILPPGACAPNCDNGTIAMGWGSGTILFDFVVPPIDSLNAKVKTTKTVLTTSPSNDLDAGASAAAGKDVALVFVNALSGEAGNVDGNQGDRNDLNLWLNGSDLVNRVAAVNKNTVVVIHSVGPVLMEPWISSPNVTAVLYAGLPGEQTGPAIIDVLYGAVNPSGRLPFTMAVNAGDYSTDILYVNNAPAPGPTIEFTETLFVDYRHFDQANITPRFEFGFGLSYTTFAYSKLSVRSAGSGATVSFTVTNTGKRDGTEIPQLYIGFPSGAGEPPKVLRGFDEVILARGASKQVVFNLAARDLGVWDTATQQFTRPSGTFSIHVGASSRDIRLEGSL